MGKSKKKFIDKKNAVTFHLVHRSQHDPLITDENAPQHVLVEAAKPTDPQKRKEEQEKYGILFDDDYDYLQHLKKVGGDTVWEYVETPNQKKEKKKQVSIQLPSSVFASEFEEEEGMLNKAAPRPGPRPDWDPDVVAALDEDFDFEDPENQLEDDFVVQAMGGEDEDDEFDEDEEYEDEEDEEEVDFDSDNLGDSDVSDAELEDKLGPLMKERRFSDEETKSRFTEYSMSSSVIRRNEQLNLLDERFEKFYATYDDTEIGGLDLEEIDGHMDTSHSVLMKCWKEFKKGKKPLKYDKAWDKERIKQLQEHDSSEEEVEMEVEDEKEKKVDCESILSTYSNIYNHPKLIEEPRRSRKIKIDPKTGIPMDVLRGADSDKLTTKSLAKFDNENLPTSGASGPKSLCEKSVLSTLSVLSIRPKDETPEEKHERKRLLKEYRAERRMEKKANALAFKDEKKRQQQIKINNQNNIQGNRIL
ncbi:unnamed protein product [Hermetia illucens]|uniref:Protein LTV1 homolog n=1 Tax=Hermetia illucens TaxID=343691 RepID=A0A7R8YXT3_HERIL|nr:protein LTV1 homolog [Hermetia illucens]CAD7088232.1 unnamed protein product [Hermetia illucens]